MYCMYSVHTYPDMYGNAICFQESMDYVVYGISSSAEHYGHRFIMLRAECPVWALYYRILLVMGC